MTQCPCGSKKAYAICCGLYLEGGQVAPTAEALMRSRYTAYTQADIDYIKKTMQGQALTGFNEENARQWAQRVTWLGLQVVKTINESPQHSFVEFIATYLEEGKIHAMHEVSEFLLDAGVWLYVDGQQQAVPNQKISRNGLCPCGSQKKFKHCHGASAKH